MLILLTVITKYSERNIYSKPLLSFKVSSLEGHLKVSGDLEYKFYFWYITKIYYLKVSAIFLSFVNFFFIFYQINDFFMHKVPENKGLTIFQNFLLSEDFFNIYVYRWETTKNKVKDNLSIRLFTNISNQAKEKFSFGIIHNVRTLKSGDFHTLPSCTLLNNTMTS